MNLGQMLLTTTLLFSAAVHAAPAPVAAKAQTTKKSSKKVSAASKTAPAQNAAGSADGQVQAKTPFLKGRPMVNSSISEFAFQPAAGYQSMTARTTYMSDTVDYRAKKYGIDKSYSDDTRGFILVARYDRGLQNGWGVAAEMGASLTPLETLSRGESGGRAKGFTDLTLSARNHKAIKMGELTYGGQFSFSPNAKELPNSREEGNLQTGGHSLAAFVGLQREQKNYVWGTQFKHQIYLDRSQTAKNRFGQTTDVTVSNGNTFELAGYMEMPLGRQLYGASASLLHTLPQDYTLKTESQKLTFDTDNMNTGKLMAYGNFALKSVPNLEIIPQLSYQKVLGSTDGSFSMNETSAQTQLTVNARLSL